MRKKAATLLLIFLPSLIPTFPVSAETISSPTITDAVNFLYLSDAVLTPESELDLAQDPTAKVQAQIPGSPFPAEVDIRPLLGRIIHAKKMERNDLDANCRLLTNQLRAEGKECEADQVQSYCKEKRAEINTLIGIYHKKRGDQRKFFTKVWHNIKRNTSYFWYQIGPVGRNFLRHMGDQALEIVVSGGTLSGGLLRNMVKNYVRTEARNRIKEVVYQGVERMLRGQLEIARAAGVDLCGEGAQIFERELAEQRGEEEVAEFRAEWACSTETGYLGDWMHASAGRNMIDKQELLFDLTSNQSAVVLDLSFHGVARIPLENATSDSIHYQKTEHLYTGKGSAEWDGVYFYGSVTMNRTETMYYETSEDTVRKDTYDHAVFGGFSPELNEIHLCFDVHTREQFEGIKGQPFDQLLANCASQNYFICTPKD